MSGDGPHKLDVGRLRRDEVPAVARLHAQWFGRERGRGSSLALLGEDWLAGAFYGANLANPHQSVHVARWNGRVVAFIHCAIDRRRIAHWALAHALPALVGGTLRAIARDPRVLRHLLANAVYLGGEKLAFLEAGDAQLTVLAVEEEFRAKSWERETGVWLAGELLTAMETDLRERGVKGWYAAPSPENPQINRFMDRVGAHQIGEASAQGIPLVYWRKRLERG